MGYLVVDNRANGGVLEEYDTVACRHCRRAITVVRRQPTGHYCMRCAGPVCDVCGADPVCRPLVEKIDAALRREAALRSMGLTG